MSVLILSTSANPHAELVAQKLEHKGVDFVKFYTDKIDTVPPLLSLYYPNTQYNRLNGESVLDLDITSVFVQHPRIYPKINMGEDDIDRDLAISSWKNVVNWLEDELNHVKWVNSPSNSRKSNSTILQLKISEKYGLKTPKTCFTNDLYELKKFFENDKVIVKSGSIPNVLPDQHRILSHIINIYDIDQENLKTSPCLFQEYIPKIYELRVHVIGNVVLCCQIQSQENKTTEVDWRNYAISKTPHYAIELNKTIENACIHIVKELNLEFGIIDLIVTPNDEIIFLECNSQGSWIWIEQLTGLNITNTLINHLTNL